MLGTRSSTSVTPSHVPFYATPLPENGLWCASMEIALSKEPGDLSSEGDLFPIECIRADSVYAEFKELSGQTPAEAAAEMKAEAAKLGISSRLLDDVPDAADAVAYAALTRSFEYADPFDVLAPGDFSCPEGTVRAGIAYFGFEGDPAGARRSEDGRMREVKVAPPCSDHVSILYYDDEEHHACEIRTKQGDRIVLVRSPEGGSASEMFAALSARADRFTGIADICSMDSLRVPMLDLDVFDAFENLSSPGTYELSAPGSFTVAGRQSTKLHIDEKGGHVESEADHWCCLGVPLIPEEGRELSYDGRFALFLIDGKAEGNVGRWTKRTFSAQHPYLALVVDDASAFQA